VVGIAGRLVAIAAMLVVVRSYPWSAAHVARADPKSPVTVVNIPDSKIGLAGPPATARPSARLGHACNALLPFLILLSAFASNRVDDDISLRPGLDRQASGIMTHLFTSSPATLNVAIATSLLFVTAGTLAMAGSLQQIYEKVFHQDHRGLGGLYRLLIWLAVLCLTAVLDTLIGRPARNASDGAVLAMLVTFAIWTPFFWWTMHSCWQAGSHGARCCLPRS
jgi:hypothetical protein